MLLFTLKSREADVRQDIQVSCGSKPCKRFAILELFSLAMVSRFLSQVLRSRIFFIDADPHLMGNFVFD